MREQLNQIYGYLYGMWRYRWSALLISWVIALVGWLVVFTLPNKYEANAVVHVDTQSVMKPLLKGLAVETDAEDELQIVSRVLLSRENLHTVLRETDMDLEAEDANAKEAMVSMLADKIQIKAGNRFSRQNKSNIYEISYSDGSPERVYQVVSKLVNTLIENTLSSSRSDTAMAQKFLDGQILEYEKRLTVAEEDLAEFKRKNVGFMPDEKGGYYQRLQSALTTLETTKSQIKLAKRRYAELNRQLKGENPILDGNSFGAGKAMQLRRYREQLESLLAQYTEQHPDVQAVRAQIEELQSSDAASGQNYAPASGSGDNVEFNPVYQEIKVELNKTGIEIETLKTELAEQQAKVTKLKESIDIIPEVEARLSKLNRDYEVTRERYLDLVERRESARLAQMVGQSGSDVTFRIIEPPLVPNQPSGPNRLLFLSAVLLAALAAGLGWSFLRYLVNPSYLNTQQIRSVIDIPVLGIVSLYMTPEHNQQRKLQLVTFLSIGVLLFCAFGVLLMFQDEGAAFVAKILSQGQVA